jgi:hypothetical protein
MEFLKIVSVWKFLFRKRQVWLMDVEEGQETTLLEKRVDWEGQEMGFFFGLRVRVLVSDDG